jgi:hypothetical protein
VARWTGAGWQPVGGGLCCGSVHAFAVHDAGSGSALFAGGDLDGDGDVEGLARWNPLAQAWIPIGAGFTGGRAAGVHALASWDAGGTPFLVVVGDFDAVDGIPSPNLARFGPGGFGPFGSGANGVVRALLAKPALPAGTALFAGGAFSVIDGRPPARFARTN